MDVKIPPVFHTLPDSIAVVDRNERIVWVNERFEQLLGKKRESLIGKNCRESLCRELGFDLSDDAINTLLQGMPGENEEIRLRDKEDNTLYFSASCMPVKDQSNNEVGVAILLREVTKITTVRIALEEKLLRSKHIMGKTINALVRAFETRDPYTAGHEQRVSQLSRCIAQKMRGVEKHWVEGVRMAAQLHDVGKIYVPSEILSNPRKLTDEEYNLVKIHARVGYNILHDVEFGFDFSIMDTILQHHERLDGMGYPSGLKDEQIIPEAKIIAVADVVEAMTNHRPYRASLGLTAALSEIKKNAGIKYDGDVVEVCSDLFLKDNFEFKYFDFQL